MCEAEIELSIVIPCLNEEATIGACVETGLDAMRRLGLGGEVVVCDNGSSDQSAQIAESAGARVVFESLPGYGSALMAGIAASHGRYIIMADGDNTYDLAEIGPFVEHMRQGKDLVMGSRFRGRILPGAMTWSHRYIGNPILSGILNVLFRTDISDSHCGMRGFSRESYDSLGLSSTGMEFASEMVFKAIRASLRIAEVPITYYPRGGTSKLNSVPDAWRHLRLMLMYSPTALYVIPGIISLVVGLVLFVASRSYPVIFAGGLFMSLGVQTISLGLDATTFSHIDQPRSGDRIMEWLWRHFNLERGILLGLVALISGVVLFGFSWHGWRGIAFDSIAYARTLVLSGVLFINGAQTVFSSFFLSMLGKSIHR